ncbi:MAG: DUF2934 domain-containing protein [Sphingobacteriales bacterium]|nr:MAG: DUF2934 domain-containing protein [Sphingobacteriales bacterium]
MNINEQRVREYAYQIWESEGRPVGHSDRHWEMASRLAQSDNSVPTPPSEPIEPISPGEPAHPSSPSEPIQPSDPQPAQPQAQAVTPPRKSRAKAVADAPARSLIDTQPLSLGVSSGDGAKPAAKKPAKAKKPKVTENESA